MFEICRTGNHPGDLPQLFDQEGNLVSMVMFQDRRTGAGPCTGHEYDYRAELVEGKEYWLLYNDSHGHRLEKVTVFGDGRIRRNQKLSAAYLWDWELPGKAKDLLLSTILSHT